MGSSLLPAWLVLPMAIIPLLVIAAHTSAVMKSDMPRTRRTIRTFNGFVLMTTTVLLAYAVGIATPSNAGVFALVWTLVMALLVITIIVAMIDSWNNVRLHAIERKKLRRQLRTLHEDVVREKQRRARAEQNA